MIEQRNSFSTTTSDEQSKVYAHQTLFEQLAKLRRSSPAAVSVMLTLVINIGAKGAVLITQAVVA